MSDILEYKKPEKPLKDNYKLDLGSYVAADDYLDTTYQGKGNTYMDLVNSSVYNIPIIGQGVVQSAYSSDSSDISSMISAYDPFVINSASLTDLFDPSKLENLVKELIKLNQDPTQVPGNISFNELIQHGQYQFQYDLEYMLYLPKLESTDYSTNLFEKPQLVEDLKLYNKDSEHFKYNDDQGDYSNEANNIVEADVKVIILDPRERLFYGTSLDSFSQVENISERMEADLYKNDLDNNQREALEKKEEIYMKFKEAI